MLATDGDEAALLAGLFRIHEEPCRHVGEEQVHRSIAARPKQYLAFVEQRLRAIARGELHVEQPQKQIFADGPTSGDFRVMPCVVRGDGGVTKTVKVVGTNFEQRVVPGQITVGRVLRLHARENFVTDIFDACLLSSARTAACAWLAAGHWVSQPRAACIVGLGRVGYYAALFALQNPKLERLLLVDENVKRVKQAARELSHAARKVPTEVQIATDTGLPVPIEADVVILATTARRPFLSRQGFSGSVVVSTGADHVAQRELEDDWALERPIYTDGYDSLAVGDLSAWERATLVETGQVRHWLELFSPERKDLRRPGVFVSTGSALMDNLTVQYVSGYLESRREASLSPGASNRLAPNPEAAE